MKLNKLPYWWKNDTRGWKTAIILSVLWGAMAIALCTGCWHPDAETSERGKEVLGPRGYYEMIEREPDSIFAPEDDE